MDKTGSIVVEELRKQAKEEGYAVFAIPREDLHLYLVYLLGIMLGWVMAQRVQ